MPARAASLLLAFAALPLVAHAEYSVDWRADRLSVSAKDAPRAELLREVARRTGTRVSGLEYLQDKVSLTLSSVDLASGLRVLAGDSSYALVETPGRSKKEPKRYQLLVVSTAKDRTMPAPGVGARGRAMPPANAPGQMQYQAPAIHQQDVLRNSPPSTTVEDPETGHRVKPPDDQ